MPQPLSLRAYDQPIDAFPAFTASVCNLNPTSRGSVRIRSADPKDPPRIAPNYLATAEDRRVLVDSLRLTRRIVAQPRFHPCSAFGLAPAGEFRFNALKRG
jgi:choline dehydrogenase